MAAAATFTSSNGAPAHTAIRAELHALTEPTVGDLLYCGQLFRTRIRQRTFAGIDVNGAPFAPYSSKGPFYLYPNRGSASSRTTAGKAARATASKNRYIKTGRIGIRTSTGIKYESYAAAKSAHGVASVNLYGMEQHTHMLDTLVVKCGGSTTTGLEDLGSDLSAFEGNYPASELQLGFYGPEAERAKGNNEGTSKLPKREFFALSPQDLHLAEKAIAQRMQIRAASGHQGPGGGGPSKVAEYASGPITLDDVGF